jgi:hypothetical protein
MDLAYCRGYPSLRSPRLRYTPGPFCEEPGSEDADVQEKQEKQEKQERANRISTDNAATAKRSESGGLLSMLCGPRLIHSVFTELSADLPHTRTGIRGRKGTYVFKGESGDSKVDASLSPKAHVVRWEAKIPQALSLINRPNILQVSWCSCMDGQQAWQHPKTGGVMTKASIRTLWAEI